MESEDDFAAIASPVAIKALGLQIIKSSIADNKENTTYFALIKKGKKAKAKKGAKKTSIAFSFKKDSPGTLNIILQLFSDNKINLAKIESRPDSKISGHYVFYIDFEKALDDKNAKNVLKIIMSKVAKLKVLGCY